MCSVHGWFWPWGATCVTTSDYGVDSFNWGSAFDFRVSMAM